MKTDEGNGREETGRGVSFGGLAAMLRVDPDLRVVDISPEMQELLGKQTSDALIGVDLPRDLFLDEPSFLLLRHLLEKDGRAHGMTGFLHRRGGESLPLRIHASRVRGQDGRHAFDELYVRPEAASGP